MGEIFTLKYPLFYGSMFEHETISGFKQWVNLALWEQTTLALFFSVWHWTCANLVTQERLRIIEELSVQPKESHFGTHSCSSASPLLGSKSLNFSDLNPILLTCKRSTFHRCKDMIYIEFKIVSDAGEFINGNISELLTLSAALYYKKNLEGLKTFIRCFYFMMNCLFHYH